MHDNIIDKFSLAADEKSTAEYRAKGLTVDIFDSADDVINAIEYHNFAVDYNRLENENAAQTRQESAAAENSDKENPVSKPENFRITDYDLGAGSPKEKYRRNVEAIKTMFAVESENRQASPEEKEILSKYVGWGGLQAAFDAKSSAWASEYAELKELLSDEQYKSARATVNDSFYTPPIVIKTMYKALENMGFESGKVLEPSMGIGNFFGMIPENMRNSKLYGVEIDDISGRIARLLYPGANIQIKGFEKTAFTSNTFDAAVGNVPFGTQRISDKDFKGSNLIHDYFFKKALDKVRPGGVTAFITSKGTLDKKDSSVRKYLAERADLLGAIRLPDNAFKRNARTDVTADIIFLQKRDSLRDFEKEELPDWVNISKDSSGIEMNSYFVNNPKMILGEMKEVSGRYGTVTTCLPFEDKSLDELLGEAVKNIKGTYISDNIISDSVIDEEIHNEVNPEGHRNFCYDVVDGNVYFCENNEMIKTDFSRIHAKNAFERMTGMIEISKCLQKLISLQLENRSDGEVLKEQKKLNTLYDDFTAKYGLLSSRTNKALFSEDDTAPLLQSLENINDKGELISKADIFSKRTIMPHVEITSVNTASEALAVSISEKAKVDLDYMAALCSKDREEIIKDLEGVIFYDPVELKYVTGDEYLSGNVREKLNFAKTFNEANKNHLGISLESNIKALEQAQPEDLKPSEISVQLGSAWVPTKYYEQFMYNLLQTPWLCQSSMLSAGLRNKNPFICNGHNCDNSIIAIDRCERTATYAISNKKSYRADSSNLLVNKTYGTSRKNAYEIIEATLNMKPVYVYDYIEDNFGKTKRVLNQKQTMKAQEKQELIKSKFKEWVFDDAERTAELCKIYNEKFNSVRPREYNGAHINFVGMNPEITLMEHQRNAVAHTLYGGNTLLAHVVGSGKTYEMAASAMESKRLGLCSKSLIAVPKAIVNQFAKEFMQLYPAANILVPNENDFSEKNRRRFCSRIATGNYDAIIISHNQLEKIPLSIERQIDFIENEIEEITNSLAELKAQKGERGFTVKELEATKKNLSRKLEELNNNDKRDSTITFEELGVDRLYVDEAHLFKNLFFTSKMGRNVAGINASSNSQRASDLQMKCRYLDEITGSKGVVFATGTPISNSMAELFTMQKYLQHDSLKAQGLDSFDAWASCFGETKLSMELKPEGSGYQTKMRFAKFFNLPELMTMFKETADIKTGDTLKLPVPDAEYHTISAEPSEHQRAMVEDLAKRANKIRRGGVLPETDNMLKITTDGRVLALDQRLMNPLLPDNPDSKVNKCIENVFDIWQNTAENKSTQIIFSDISTPGGKSGFCVYDDIREKLINKGIPKEQIAFIHDYSTDAKKQELFKNMNKGNIRVLLGSTNKLGTGVNVQERLKAVHHIDCPFRPSDLEQRNGRIIRQGNTNKNVDIYNYVTKGTFDAYLYQIVENKQKFIAQIMTSKSPARSAEDVDEATLNYAQIKAIAAGDPKIREKMDLDIEVTKLRTLFADWQNEKRDMQSFLLTSYPVKLKECLSMISSYDEDIALADKTKGGEFAGMTVNDKFYSDKKEAGQTLLTACTTVSGAEPVSIGEYRGFNMAVKFDSYSHKFIMTLKNKSSFSLELSDDTFGNITRIDNALNNGFVRRKAEFTNELDELEKNAANAKIQIEKPFARLDELHEKEQRLNQLNLELSSSKAEPEEADAPEKNGKTAEKSAKKKAEACL
ncbi:MAG: N-domain protein, SNF2 family [Clostridiales bacterium]|nr:N-domain protein, SNF2 family [Clostridiales bacterium]